MSSLHSIVRPARVGAVVVRNVFRHGLSGESARLAFFFFFAIFPLLLVLFALTGYLGGDAGFQRIMSLLSLGLPPQGALYLDRYVRELASERRPGLLSMGLGLAAWSASNIFASLTHALNKVYGIAEGRNWLRRRLLSFGLLVLVSLVLIFAATGLFLVPKLLAASGVAVPWRRLAPPLAFVCAACAIYLVLRWVPDHGGPKSSAAALLAALFGATLWTLLTSMFRIYVTQSSLSQGAYKVVGGVLALLLWLYLIAMTLLLSAELAAALASEDGAGGGRGRQSRKAR